MSSLAAADLRPCGPYTERATVALGGTHGCYVRVNQPLNSTDDWDMRSVSSTISSLSSIPNDDEIMLRADREDMDTSALWVLYEEDNTGRIMLRCGGTYGENYGGYLCARRNHSVDVKGVHGEDMGIFWTVVLSPHGNRMSFRSIYGTYLGVEPPTQESNQVVASATKIDGWERFTFERVSPVTDWVPRGEWHFLGEGI